MIMSENEFNVSGFLCPACGCVGYAYVPVQEINETYAPDKALMEGTVFPELNLTICEYGKVCKKWGGGMND